MNPTTLTPPSDPTSTSETSAPACDCVFDGAATLVQHAGTFAMRYGLVVILLWIGGMKFTAYESEGISGFVANSPLMGWTYSVLSKQGFSNVLGVVEIAIGLMIAARYLLPRVSAVGSLLAAGMFLTTLSFLLTTPGIAVEGLGFPSLSVPGQFLIKDLALLGVSLWTAAEAWQAARKA